MSLTENPTKHFSVSKESIVLCFIVACMLNKAFCLVCVYFFFLVILVLKFCRTVVYMADILRRFLKRAIDSEWFLLCWESTYSEVGTKKSLNTALIEL